MLGFFVDAKVVVAVLVGLLLLAGLRVAPFDALSFDWLERDPIPVDAIPDVGENQQIVFTEWPGRSPRDVEDQVTYPLTTALLGVAGVRTVRSSSALGVSMIYVVFEDGVDFYFSRSRLLEKLASLAPGTLPEGVSPTLGPDATALGQVFWYTLEGRDPEGRTVGGWDLHELRSIQDWTVRYALSSVAGVSEVASIGGHVREYQVDVDPDALRAHGVALPDVARAVRESNLDVGARTMEINRVEYVLRGVGFVRALADLEAVVVRERDNTPIRVRDVAHVHLGPALRAGGLDDAGAEAVGGVVVARFRGNPRAVIDGVNARIAEIAPGLPRRTLEDGTVSQVTIVPFYDRAELIDETVDTLSTALWQQLLITVIVVLVLLGNLRTSVVVGSLLPLGVLFALVVMRYAGVDANLMALGGIAIAIGTMVDIGIVLAENVVQHLDEAAPDADRGAVVTAAAAEVAPAVLTSVATTVVSFLPVFGLTAAEARLFAPLAYAKTFAMGGAFLIGVLVLPALAHVVLRRRPAAPEASPAGGLARVIRSIFRVAHARDWLLVAAGAALATWSLAAGAFVVALGVSRLARPLLPPRVATWIERAELALAAIGVTLALATDWSPLGPARGALLNAVFVGGLVALVLGPFKLFTLAYPHLLRLFLRHKAAFLAFPAALVVLGLLVWLGAGRVLDALPEGARDSAAAQKLARALPGLGREYMPPFDEGAYLYMPTTMPHASAGEVRDALARMDAAIAEVPEVDRVVGKWGRAASALDPAPTSMIETIVTYRPEYRVLSDGTRVRQWREHIRSPRDIWDEVSRAAGAPGLTGAPMLMPIAARVVMLQSGMRAAMGVKVQGPDLETIERFARRVEELLREVPEVRPETVFAERVVGKPYLEIVLDREAIARYGLTIVAVQDVLSIALGGAPLTSTVEGRERYPVRVRYMREERDGVEALERVMVPAPSGEAVPLGQLAHLRYVRGPEMIRSEDTFLTSYVLFDRRADVPDANAVEAAQRFLEAQIASGALEVPAGVRFTFAGTYEAQLRSEARLRVLIPLALALVFLLLYLQFRRISTTVIIGSGVAVAVSGAFLLLWLYAQPWFLDLTVFETSMRELFRVGPVNLSVAVWVGVIALIGVATDDGVVISTYLAQRFRDGPAASIADVRARVLEAGTRRLRPCLMTTATTILALAPVVTSPGRGADVMVPMALPSVGGMVIELMTLFVVPVLYAWVEERRVKRAGHDPRDDAPAREADEPDEPDESDESDEPNDEEGDDDRCPEPSVP
ncbi:MAG: efflux RND transporter permease subunit [Sandaracinaceae bacterium]|nr:efflux RND transporter permease subunit [Sandaracinaceae bacterium]